jgi:hypothetical protein
MRTESKTRKNKNSVNRNETARRKSVRMLRQKIPSIRTLRRKDCPPGMIARKSYTRRYSTAVRKSGFTVRRSSGKVYKVYPKVSDMVVKSRCIKNTGKPGKGPQLFGRLKKGELSKLGYSFRASESQRITALKRAIEHYGSLGVYRKLDAVAKLSKKINPAASKIFKIDRDWVHKQIV